MTTSYYCPDCGAPLEIDDAAQTEQPMFRNASAYSHHSYVETVSVTVPIAFCTGCEFLIVLEGGRAA